jgi:hypothetical protein
VFVRPGQRAGRSREPAGTGPLLERFPELAYGTGQIGQRPFEPFELAKRPLDPFQLCEESGLAARTARGCAT